MHEMVSFMINFGSPTEKFLEGIEGMRNICKTQCADSSMVLNLGEGVSMLGMRVSN